MSYLYSCSLTCAHQALFPGDRATRKFAVFFGEITTLSNTGSFEGKLLVKIASQWGLAPSQIVSVTTDGAADARKAARTFADTFTDADVAMPCEGIVCFAHGVSLVIGDCNDLLENVLGAMSKILVVYGRSGVLHHYASLADAVARSKGENCGGLLVVKLVILHYQHMCVCVCVYDSVPVEGSDVKARVVILYDNVKTRFCSVSCRTTCACFGLAHGRW